MLVWPSSLPGCISGQGEAAHGKGNNPPKYHQPLVCDGSLLDHICKVPVWCPQGTWLHYLHSLKWFPALQTSAAAWRREDHNNHVSACRNHIPSWPGRRLDSPWSLLLHTQPGSTHTKGHLTGNRRCHFQQPGSSDVPWNTTRYRWRCPSILWHLLHTSMLRKWRDSYDFIILSRDYSLDCCDGAF